MTEQEIGSMIIRLTGDGSMYQKMLFQAEQSTKTTMAAVQTAMTKIEGFKGTLTGFAASALGVLSSFGLVSSLRAAFDQYTQFEAGQIRLNAFLKANGKEIESTTMEYRAFAKEIADVTTMTKGAVMAMVQQGEARGLTNQQVKDAVQMSTALSGALGGEASSHMHVAIAIQEGNIHMLKRALHLHNVKDQSEVLAKAQKILAAGWEAAQAQADSAAGQITKLQNSLKEFGLEVGTVVAEYVKPLVEWLARTIDQFKQMEPEVKKQVVLVLALAMAIPAIGPAWMAMSAVASAALAPVNYLIGLTASLVGVVLSTALSVVGVAAWLAWSAAAMFAQAIVMAFNAALTVMQFLFSTQGLTLIISSALLIGYALTVGAVKAAVWLWNAALVAWNVISGAVAATLLGQTALAGGYTVGTLIAKAATWLWNAALTVTNALLTAGLAIIPAVVAVIVTYVAAVAAAVAAGALLATGWAAIVLFGKEMWQSFRYIAVGLKNLEGGAGFVQHFIDLFGEWKGIVTDLVRAVQVDMTLAWDIVVAAAELAVNQIKDMWKPVWGVIKAGFVLVGLMIKEELYRNFSAALDLFVAKAAKILDLVKAQFVKGLMDVSPGAYGSRKRAGLEDIDEKIARLKKAADEAEGTVASDAVKDIAKAHEALEKLLKDFKVTPSAKTDAIKDYLDLLRAGIKPLEKVKPKYAAPDIPKIPDQKVKVTVDKFALVDSVEDALKRQAYANEGRFTSLGASARNALVPVPVRAGAGEGGAGGGDRAEAVTKKAMSLDEARNLYLCKMADSLLVIEENTDDLANMAAAGLEA
jgi:hypothetical protein